MPTARVSEITGCPFVDAYVAGLTLSPKLDCGPAHTVGDRLVWDPSQPVWLQLRELAEQTAKWRNRRGLHIVRTPIATKGVHDEDTTGVHATGRVRTSTDTERASGRAGLRDTAHSTDPADWVQNDAPGVHMRRSGKLPLGV